MARSDASGFSAGMPAVGQVGVAARAGKRPMPQRWAGGDAAGNAQDGPGLDERGLELGRWPNLLADLALLGTLWVQLEGSGLRLSQRAALAGLRVTGALGHLDSPAMVSRILLDGCDAIRPLAEEAGLAIDDERGRPVVRLERDRDAHPWVLRLLLASIGATEAAVRPAVRRAGSPLIASVGKHAIGRLQQDLDRLGNGFGHGLALVDLAELTGRLPMQLPRFRPSPSGEGSRALAVDPSLVPSVLETLAEQVHPIMLTTGSTGWVNRAQVQFYGHRLVDRRLFLRGDAVRLELEVTEIDSAWLVGPVPGSGSGRSLRLYDAQGRAMAVISSAEACAGEARAGAARDGEAPLWRSLMNALSG